ncbi:DUF484 family protein [Halomonadaceae bacterium KBTZ08]
MTDPTAEPASATVSEADVARYLEANPDFFERHEALLQKLRLPHDSGEAISLVERQVHLFREQRDALREELSGLIGIARQNDQLFARSKRLLMQLLDARSVEEVAAILDETIRGEFQLQGATLTVLTDGEPPSQCGAVRYLGRDEARAVFGEALDESQPLFGRLRDSHREALFAAPDQVGSAAVIPVRRDECLGLIAIASAEEGYFHSSMGSLFMAYISDTLGRLLPPLLAPEGRMTPPEAEAGH